MIRQECIDELADFAGLQVHAAAIAERAMQGGFKPTLRQRVALLGGFAWQPAEFRLAPRALSR